MASLGTERFYKRAKTGEELDFTSRVSVTRDGVFRMTVPIVLETALSDTYEEFGDWEIDNVRSTLGQGDLAVRCKDLDRLKSVIQRAMNDYLTCDETVERVIVYGEKCAVAYAKTPDGEFFENCWIAGDDAEWAKGYGIHATNHTPYYTVGIVARVYNKHTFTRPSGVRVEYRDPDIDNFSKCPVGRLNGFVGVYIKHPANLKEMPYSDEAAEFFFSVMLSVCRLADRISAFINNEGAVAKAIKSGGGGLLQISSMRDE